MGISNFKWKSWSSSTLVSSLNAVINIHVSTVYIQYITHNTIEYHQPYRIGVSPVNASSLRGYDIHTGDQLILIVDNNEEMTY